MKNLNPIYLIEANFWKKTGEYLKNDWRHTKEHLFGFGRGGRFVRKGKKIVKILGADATPENIRVASGAANGLVNKGSTRVKVNSEIDKFLNTQSDWQNSKDVLFSEIGDKYRGAKEGISKAWDKTKRGLKSAKIGEKTKKVAHNTGSAIGTGVGLVGLGGVGLVGAAMD